MKLIAFLILALCACGASEPQPAAPSAATLAAPDRTATATATATSEPPAANDLACAIGQPMSSAASCDTMAMVGTKRLCFASEPSACACACAEAGKSPRACTSLESFPPIAACE